MQMAAGAPNRVPEPPRRMSSHALRTGSAFLTLLAYVEEVRTFLRPGCEPTRMTTSLPTSPFTTT
jgi:hypothetical protein